MNTYWVKHDNQIQFHIGVVFQYFFVEKCFSFLLFFVEKKSGTLPLVIIKIPVSFKKENFAWNSYKLLMKMLIRFHRETLFFVKKISSNWTWSTFTSFEFNCSKPQISQIRLLLFRGISTVRKRWILPLVAFHVK